MNSKTKNLLIGVFFFLLSVICASFIFFGDAAAKAKVDTPMWLCFFFGIFLGIAYLKKAFDK